MQKLASRKVGILTHQERVSGRVRNSIVASRESHEGASGSSPDDSIQRNVYTLKKRPRIPASHEGTRRRDCTHKTRIEHQSMVLCTSGRLRSSITLWYRKPLLREVSKSWSVCLPTEYMTSLLRLPYPRFDVSGVNGDIRECFLEILREHTRMSTRR